MRSFKDSLGRCWDIDITVAAVKRIKSRLVIDLLSIVSDTKLSQRIISDPIFVGDIVYVACLPQAEKLQLDQEHFDAAVDGPVIGIMMQAFCEALTDFFQSSQPEVAAAIREAMKIKLTAGPILIAEVEKATPLMLERLKKIKIESLMPPESGKSSMSAPESAE